MKKWILAARPKTLFVSVAPVLAGSALAYFYACFNWVPATICLLFALLAQITSNFVNDYADHKKGSDRTDRVGPARMVASGVISPRLMLRATLITLGLALSLGLSLIFYGGFQLILVGLLVAIFALGYSMGPYPLSYHGLGDVAVFLFFGVVPVTFTYYTQGHNFPIPVLLIASAVGFVAVNLLIINNYRDMEADIISRKRTTVVLFGRKVMSWVYLGNMVIALGLGVAVLGEASWTLLPFGVFSAMLFAKFKRASILKLDGVLGMSALNVLIYAVCVAFALLFVM